MIDIERVTPTRNVTVVLEPDRQPRRTFGQVVIVIYAVYAFAYLVGSASGWAIVGEAKHLIDLAFLPARFLPVIMSAYAARSLGEFARLRRAWLGITFALLALGITDLIQILFPYGPTGAVFPSWADFVRLAFYPFGLYVVLAGTRVYLHRYQERFTIWLDFATVLVGSAMLLWYLVFESGLISTGPDRLAVAVAIVYPSGDLSLLLGLTIVLVKQDDPRVRRTLRLLTLGMLCLLIGDFTYAILSLSGPFRRGGLVDLIWVAAGAFVAASALWAVSWSREHETSAIPAVGRERASTNWFPYAFVAAGYVLLLLSAREEWGSPRSGIYVGIVALTAVVVARQVVVLRDNARLVVEARAEIAERVQTEATVSVLRRRLELILDAAAEGVFGLDGQGRITFVNPSAARAFDWRPEAVLGRDAFGLIGHAASNRVHYDQSTSPVLLAIRDGEAHASLGDFFERSDRSAFPVEYVSTPIRESGEIVGAVVTFSDITQRVNAEVELRQSQKLEAVGRLAAGIAHEMNTPIQFVGDNTRFLRDGLEQLFKVVATYADLRVEVESGGSLVAQRLEAACAAERDADLDYVLAEFPKAFDQTLDGIERVASIVRALKEFAHPDAKEQMPADLNGALQTTLTVARNELKYIGEVETDLNPIPLVRCHLGELNQVFLNLLVNAAHAIADAGRSGHGLIRVSTSCNGDHVVVAISDNGCGIPDAIRMRVYEPFFTTKEVGRGTGQGLAIARSIVVDKHQGALTFESTPGLGTTFRVRLPVVGRSVDANRLAA